MPYSRPLFVIFTRYPAKHDDKRRVRGIAEPMIRDQIRVFLFSLFPEKGLKLKTFESPRIKLESNSLIKAINPITSFVTNAIRGFYVV